MEPLLYDKESGITKLASLFSTAALSPDPNRWINLARSLAVQLRNPGIDWRDLTRALEHVRHNDLDAAVAGFFDRAALLAMRLSDSSTPPKASVEMLDACGPGVEPESMLRSVIAILQRQIPFDLVSFAEYYHGDEATTGTTLVRGRFAMDSGVEFQWPARWVDVPEGLARWAEGEVRWVADSEKFYEENPHAEVMRNNIVTREYEARRATSYLVAPLFDGNRVKAVLTLARRRDNSYGPFGQADQIKLDALSLESVLRRVQDAFEARTQVIAQELVGLFTPDAQPTELARQLVKKLSRGFGWEYVGLFRVNRARNMFEVVAEYDSHGELSFTTNYEQPLTAGMLGRTLDKGHALYVADVTQEPTPHDYIRVSDYHKSTLTFPIKIGLRADAEIEWILDLESSQFNAFPRPDQEVLRQVILEIERAVALWFEARLAAALLNVVEQGVVVLGGSTRIERANVAALKLLGLPKEHIFSRSDKRTDFKRYAADRTTREFLAGDQVSSVGMHLRLKGADGIIRTALAVASYRDEAFHRRVLLLADVEQAEWIGALKYMETAVRTVAAQAHGRLLLTGALLASAQKKLSAEDSSSARGLIDRASRNLSRADLPFERIASVFDVVSAPKRRNGFLDLAAELRRFWSLLPDDEVEHIELGFEPDKMLVVRGDPERLAFAFRSLLGHLLAVGTAESPLRVSLEEVGSKAFVKIVLTTQNSASIVSALSEEPLDSNQPDQIARVESMAFEVATHATEAVRKVMRAHAARLEVRREGGRTLVILGGMRIIRLEKSDKDSVDHSPGFEEVPV
ncbi:hypothetical protein IHQ71_29205 (plasmid) [Rhizobium sp. TH2]|uniref:hypothetical protein n=1 Tax=Rhizobium sp. TH2 TaxID=2775403 RepID=UPI00215795D1|nr:hypothetical protein [Rhizobium sp. TH2]UVC12307.1 hypothetical protein IHQ71_29205 [Rhizobium sp. TH2]